ncbi:hypothetical protein CHUAL_012197 [Chamberlinius hualienensis]
MKLCLIILCLTAILTAEAKFKLLKSKKYSEVATSTDVSEYEDTEAADKYIKNDDDDKSGSSSGRCNCHIRPATYVIKAIDFNLTNIAIRNYSCHQNVVTNLKSYAVLVYYNIDFGINATALNIAFSNCQKSPISSKVVVTIPELAISKAFYVRNTGGRCGFITLDENLIREVSGIHSVFFHFYTDVSYPDDEAMDFLWFAFYQGPKCINPLSPPVKLISTDEEYEGQLPSHDKFKVIKAVDFNKTIQGMRAFICNELIVTHIINQTYILYKKVDFGDEGATGVTFNFTTESTVKPPNARIDIYIGEALPKLGKSNLISSFELSSQSTPWKKCESFIKKDRLPEKTAGVNDISFIFTVHSNDPTKQTFDLVSFQLHDS